MTHYSLPVERSVLSALIYEPHLFDRVGHTLNSADLWLPFHQQLLSTIKALVIDDKPIDEELIMQRMVRAKQFDEQAMMEVLAANAVADVEKYISELKEMRQRRDLLQLSRTLPQSLEEAEDVDSVIRDIYKSIDDIASAQSVSVYRRKPITEAKGEKTKFILGDWLPFPVGVVGMLVSEGGMGKTWAVIQIAFRYARENPDKRVAMWLSEDPEGETAERARSVANDILNTPFNTFSNVDIFEDIPETLIKNKKIDLYEFKKLKKNLAGYDVIILDPLSSFYGGEENDNSQAVQFMLPFKKWALEEDITIIFLHHSAKGENNVRGASALRDGTRVVYGLSKIYTDAQNTVLDESRLHERKFQLIKDNYGVIRLLKDFTVERWVTPRESARVCVTEYQMPPVGMPQL